MTKYDKTKMFEAAKKVIDEHKLFFVEDIVAFLPCSRSWFWEAFPKDSDEMDALSELLDENKIRMKSSIRAKLYKSTKAAELLALYRLLATSEEHKKLNQSYIDHTSEGKKMKSPTIIIQDVD